MVKTTVKALRVQDKEALETKIKDLNLELLTIRATKSACTTQQKLSKIKALRRGIARVLSTIQQKHRDVLKKNFEKTKAVLSRFTTKNSRAIRKALTKHQRNKKTERQRKKDMAFQVHRYAIRAETASARVHM